MYTIIVNQSSFVRLQYWSSSLWKGYHNLLFNWRISWTEQSVYAPICFLLCGLERPTYLCLKDGSYTDSNTAFATGELRAAHPTVLCSGSLSNTLYKKTENFAASVFIPICAGVAPAR